MTPLLLVLLSLPAQAESVRDNWLAFSKAGCDVSAIQSPAVSRVLRNTPFAIQGRPFTSVDLAALYAADGDWYKPVKGEVQLSDADTACVAKLKAQEDKLRSRHCLVGDAQAALSSAPDVWLWHLKEQFAPWEETQIPKEKGRGDPCKGTDQETSFVQWTVEVGAFTAPDPTKLALPEGIRRMYEGAQSDEALAAANTSVDGWLKAGKTVRWMTSLLNAEFMSADWVCFSYSLP